MNIYHSYINYRFRYFNSDMYTFQTFLNLNWQLLFYALDLPSDISYV